VRVDGEVPRTRRVVRAAADIAAHVPAMVSVDEAGDLARRVLAARRDDISEVLAATEIQVARRIARTARRVLRQQLTLFLFAPFSE